MMSEIESITAELPGLDCGSCGAPTCMAFAEDIVKNETSADECTVIMREMFHDYLARHKGTTLADEYREYKGLSQKENDGSNGAAPSK